MWRRRFRADQRGTVAILVGLGASVLMGAGAVGLDLGLVFQARRKAQGAVDVAAMLAASNATQADAQARRSLSDNGYGGATVSVTTGAYDGSDVRVAAGSRFRAGAAPANAVRVGLQTSVPVHFARMLGLPRSVDIRVTGTAASAQFSAFTIGSGTVALDGGIANALLGSMLGTRLSLGAMDYDALAGARIDAFRFLDALAVSLRLQAASYTEIVQASAGVGQVAAALKVAAQGTPAASPLAALQAALPGTGTLVPVSQIVDLGDSGSLAPGRGLAGPSVAVMDLVSATAAVANGRNQVSVDLGLAVPGLSGTRLTLAVGERRQSSGWVRPGGANATVRTSQTRLLIETTLAAPLGLGSVTLPLYAEIAPAQATLRAVTCPWTAAGRRQVVLDAQTGLASLAIADVPRSAVASGAASPDLSRGAALIGLPSLTVKGQARASLGSPAPQTLTFSDDDIARRTVRTIMTTGVAQSLTGSLIQSLTLDVNGVGLVSPLLRPALVATLSAAAPALDLVLDNTLRILGVRLGYADLTVDGTLCNQAVLVQ